MSEAGCLTGCCRMLLKYKNVVKISDLKNPHQHLSSQVLKCFSRLQPERLQTPEPHRRSYRDNDRPRRSPSPRYRRSRSPRRFVL